jgi:hypothetical protein
VGDVVAGDRFGARQHAKLVVTDKPHQQFGDVVDQRGIDDAEPAMEGSRAENMAKLPDRPGNRRPRADVFNTPVYTRQACRDASEDQITPRQG